MRQLLTILVIFGVLYALYYMYLLLQAKDEQVGALLGQLQSTQRYLKQAEVNTGTTADALKSANAANKKLQTTGGSIEAFFSNIF